jgi:hypothetical protein
MYQQLIFKIWPQESPFARVGHICRQVLVISVAEVSNSWFPGLFSLGVFFHYQSLLFCNLHRNVSAHCFDSVLNTYTNAPHFSHSVLVKLSLKQDHKFSEGLSDQLWFVQLVKCLTAKVTSHRCRVAPNRQEGWLRYIPMTVYHAACMAVPACIPKDGKHVCRSFDL